MYVCVCRQGASALHCGSEPLGHAGACLPDDPTKPDAGGGHQNGEGPPRGHPQPRVPSPAQWPGRHPEGEPQDVATELKACQHTHTHTYTHTHTHTHTHIMWEHVPAMV